MAEGVQSGQDGELVQAITVARDAIVQHAANGVRYAAFGENNLAAGELGRIAQAVPAVVAAALGTRTYYFVPLAMSGSATEREHRGGAEETMIASAYTPELGDNAICHRNVTLNAGEGVFISTRLLNDRFALAFEFFINVGHAFVEAAGVPQAFEKLAWEQALKDVRGETSQDAWESRGQALVQTRIGTVLEGGPKMQVNEKAKTEYLEAAFSDAIAIYQLSLAVDFHYSELREREYPLLAPQALAERLRLVAQLFPPNPGYEFAIRYRRRA